MATETHIDIRVSYFLSTNIEIPKSRLPLKGVVLNTANPHVEIRTSLRRKAVALDRIMALEMFTSYTPAPKSRGLWVLRSQKELRWLITCP